jgi:hypothetical protein
MARGRKITLHLVEGKPNGVIRAQLFNWVGLVTQAPRTKLDDLAEVAEVNRPGVYVLSGTDPDDPSIRAVYIGQSEQVFERLRNHENSEDKSFFDQVTVITSADEHLTRGHIGYLESRLIQIAYETKRATVKNTQRPDLPSLPLSDQDEMETFLDHLQILLPVLGLTFALPRPTRSVAMEQTVAQKPLFNSSPVFTMTTKEQGLSIEVLARAQLIESDFVVLAGSTALKRNESQSYKSIKDRLIRDRMLVEETDMLRFADDALFSSPSAAAAVVRGQNTNGRTYWKLPDGTTYGDWFDRQIDARVGQRQIRID